MVAATTVGKAAEQRGAEADGAGNGGSGSRNSRNTSNGKPPRRKPRCTSVLFPFVAQLNYTGISAAESGIYIDAWV